MTMSRGSRLLLAASAVAVLAGCQARSLQSIIAPPTEAGVGPDQAVTTGLVAHWSCDEAGGDVLHDSSGHGHDGQMTGGTFTSGHFGNALALESGQYVTVPGFPNASSSWTVSAWMFMKSPLPESGDAALLTTDLASTGGWAMNINDVQMKADFRYWDGTQKTSDGYESYACFGCLAPDRWVHLVYVLDGDAKTLTLYTDGDRRDPIPIQDVIKAGSTNLLIGAGSPPSLYYTGLLDDIAVYARALSATEVRLVREAALPGA